MKAVIVLLSAATLLGCSSIEKSALTGTLAGGAVGAGIGSQMESKNQIGSAAAIGALTGAIFSYLSHRYLEKRDKKVRTETLFNLEKYNIETPLKWEE